MNKILKSLLLIATTLSIIESGTALAADKLETAATKFVEANGIKFSYRTLGPQSGTPLVFLQHFTGNMDAWDPAVVNALAKHRPVVVFNNRGVGATNGVVADNIAQMTTDAYAFIQALGYKQVDVLGFSMGGFVAQELAAQHPELVRKVILAGTTHQGGGNHLMKVLGEAFSRANAPDPRDYLFFSQSDAGKQAAAAFLSRVYARKEGRDPESGKEIADAHGKALIVWTSTPDPEFKTLKAIQQPVLVVTGSNDTMLPTEGSITLYKQLKNAQLLLYPDSNHGSIFQYHDSFVNTAEFFLSH
ncbi:alpha/beta hydrolase [Methylophilus sp. YYY-1]|uniref:alpha/beta fold hydrolase n=1 Tax=Methylophilus sp. YYY-1 TaxID=2682087 RepID=UPI0023B2B210|nr:alpha/beta hydrolase [Methylophilus sp. YYY-1]MDF0377598.1 alpha/beta fold hydrolase [Methylophilus sp. YYY-1]